MGKKSRKPKGRSRGGGRKIDAVVTACTRELLATDEKIKKQYIDGTLTVKTLRIAVATALDLDEEGIKKTVKAALLAYMDEHEHEENEDRIKTDRIREKIAQLKAENAEMRADSISVRVAEAKAAAKAALPNEESSANRRFITALFALRDAIVIDDDDQANFDDYMNSTGRDDMSAEHRVKIVARWPRLRKYWPRLRRRICSACGKGTLDLSEPRLLVCGGCGEGRNVGRYCSEDCQRAHWPEHQKECFKFHALPADLRPMLGNKSGRDTLVKRWMESMENGLTLEEAVEDSLCKSML